MGLFGKRKEEPAAANKDSFFRTAAKIDDLYTMHNELGSGGFAVVRLGTDKATGKNWAVKMIRNNVFKKNKDQTEAEVEVLRGLDHPGVVKLKEVVQTDKYYCIVMELMSGGELFDRIVEREKYTENDAREVSREILEAIRYVHSRDVVHRDLKPENILFSAEDKLKITDFGFAAFYDKRVGLTQSCGTPEYVAPEIIDEQGRPYTPLVDMWSAGVIIYILLCGSPPFYGDSDDEMFERIQSFDFEFPRPYWDPVSETAKDLIRKLLCSAEQRLSAEEALQHPWFKSGAQQDAPELTGALTELQRFQATMKLRFGVMALVAANKFTSLVQG